MTVSSSLDEQFRNAAAAEGLLDVAYDLADTPVGTLLVAASGQGLCRISFDPEPEREVERLARSFGARVLRASRPLDDVRRQLDEYFDEQRTDFELAVDLTPVADFTRQVLTRLAKVPHGQLTTYGALAKAAGRPTGRPRSRDGHEPQPDPDRAALPQGRRRQRRPGRVRRRARSQAAASDARGRDA